MAELQPDGTELLLRLEEMLQGKDVILPPHYLEKCIEDNDLKIKALPLICQEVLEMRIIGKGETFIKDYLMNHLGIGKEWAEDLMNLASLAGTEAADVEDLIKDPSVAVNEMVYEHLIDRDLAIALVNMAINMFHTKINELNDHDCTVYEELGVNPDTVKLNLRVSKYILENLDKGRDRETILRSLVKQGILEEGSADAFMDDVLLAKTASDRIRNGEDGLQVFEELRLQDLSAYVMMLALDLVEEGGVFGD